MDDWAVCVGLGCRRTVTARALRLVTGFFLGLRPTTPRHRRSAVVKKSRAPRLGCTSADFAGVSEIAHPALA